MKKKKLFFIFGGSWGPLCRTHVNENFRAARPHHRADMYNKGKKITASFFIYIWATIYKNVNFWLFGGPWMAHK